MTPPWLTSLWSLPLIQSMTWAMLAGMIGLLWGFGELVGAFKNETGRALRTNGAWMLLLLNFVAAALTFLLTSAVAPGANSWLAAIGIGFAWPTLIRNTTLKLVQPLQPDAADGNFALRFEQAYAAVQALARQLINASLTRQRMKLVTQAVELSMSELEQYARLAIVASPLSAQSGGPPADEFITQIMQRDVKPDIKKAMLAAFILQFFDRTTLEELLRQQRSKANKPPKENRPAQGTPS
jgi:hypothetical protein